MRDGRAAEGGTPPSCPAGTHACGATCADDRSPLTCGTSCTPCPAPAGGTATCDGVRCDFTCGAGLRRCGNACVSGCCGDADCPPQAGKTGRCDPTSRQCVYTCASGTKPCGAACIPTGDCCTEADCAGFACTSNRCSTSTCASGYKKCGAACIDAAACCPAPEQCFNGLDDDCDGKPDCADPDCQPTAMCVPTAPGGFALGVRVGMNESCPPGYTAKSTTVHRGLTTETDCTGCSCSVSPTVCKPTVHVYSTLGECEADTQNIGGTPMREIDAPDTCQLASDDFPIAGTRFVSVRANATCTPQGTRGTPKPPRWTESFKFCERSGTAGAGCPSGQVCVDRTASKACVLSSTAQTCSGAYVSAYSWHTGFSDTRQCGACGCEVTGGACPGPVVSIYRAYYCDAAQNPPLYSLFLNQRRCTEVDYGPVARYDGSIEQASCASRSVVTTGTASPTGQHVFCCLP